MLVCAGVLQQQKGLDWAYASPQKNIVRRCYSVETYSEKLPFTGHNCVVLGFWTINRWLQSNSVTKSAQDNPKEFIKVI